MARIDGSLGEGRDGGGAEQQKQEEEEVVRGPTNLAIMTRCGIFHAFHGRSVEGSRDGNRGDLSMRQK